MSSIEADAPAKSRSKSILREIIETLLLTAVIFFAVNSVTGRFKIDGSSMDDTFHHGQYIIVGRVAYNLGEPQRGDVIVFVPPGSDTGTFWDRMIGKPGETDFIKRIIGLPGDTVEIVKGQVRVNGVVLYEPYIRGPMQAGGTQSWVLGADEFFVLGDNRNASKDSRDATVGPIPLDRIVGKAWVVYFPIADWALVEHYRFPELATGQ